MSMTDGLRSRLLHDSLRAAVTDGLAPLGWFDEGRTHKPVQVVAEPVPWQQPITPNMIAITADGVDTDYRELGSLLADNTVKVVIDLYAEGDSLGLELANDIRDILRGRLGTTAARSVVPIYDYRQPTPSIIGGAGVEGVRVVRSTVLAQEAWLRHWFTIVCELHDTYLVTG